MKKAHNKMSDEIARITVANMRNLTPAEKHSAIGDFERNVRGGRAIGEDEQAHVLSTLGFSRAAGVEYPDMRNHFFDRSRKTGSAKQGAIEASKDMLHYVMFKDERGSRIGFQEFVERYAKPYYELKEKGLGLSLGEFAHILSDARLGIRDIGELAEKGLDADGILDANEAAKHGVSLARISEAASHAGVAKALGMGFGEFVTATHKSGLGMDGIAKLVKNGFAKMAHLNAAEEAVKKGVPAEFIVEMAENGLKFTSPDQIEKARKLSAHFPLKLIKANQSMLAFGEDKLKAADEIGETVKDPAAKLKLLEIGAAPAEVKALAKGFGEAKIAGLLALAKDHGATAEDLLRLKDEGVSESHFGEVLGAVHDVGESEKQERLSRAVSNYKAGLRQRSELTLAHHLHGHVESAAMPKVVGFGLEHGIRDIELLKFLHSAAKATRETHSNILSTLNAMSMNKSKSSRQLGVASGLEKWDAARTNEMAARMKSHRRE